MIQKLTAIVCAQNHMTDKEMGTECTNENWLPLLVMRMDGNTFLPVFKDDHVATRFRERNLPKDWRCWLVDLVDWHFALIDKMGLRLMVLDFPKKIQQIVEFDVEVLEHDREHGVVFAGNDGLKAD